MFVHKLKRKEVFANRGTESDSEDEIKAVLDADQHLEEDERPYSRQGEMFYKGFKTHRTLITGQFYFLVFAQLILLWFLAFEVFYSDDSLEALKEAPDNGTIVFSRFLCAIFLHITLNDEIT